MVRKEGEKEEVRYKFLANNGTSREEEREDVNDRSPLIDRIESEERRETVRHSFQQHSSFAGNLFGFQKSLVLKYRTEK